MPTRCFDGILIDFYGTISDGDRDIVDIVCRRIVEAYGLTVTPQTLAQAWGQQFFGILQRSSHEHFRTLRQCEIDSLRYTLASFGEDAADVEPFAAELDEYWANPPIHADAIDFLQRVKLPICCVSNADTKPLLAAIKKHRLHFDAVVTSEASRSYKPDSVIFERAVGMLGIRPDRAVHVGDSLHSDVGGAKKLGIHAIWICRPSRILDIGTARPNRTINTLAELTPRAL